MDNKKLEKELGRWRHKHFDGERDGNSSGEYLRRDSQLSIARHFYDLALAQVREHVLKEMRANDDACEFSSTHNKKVQDAAIYWSAANEDRNTIRYIDSISTKNDGE